MAYKYVSQIACSNNIEVFLRLRDFICARSGTYDYSITGIGWSLVDSSYAIDEDNISADDWFVIKSTGENSDFNYYIKFIYTTTYIKTQSGLYWDTVSHSMASNTASYLGNSININTTDIPVLSIYGDLDCFIIWFNKTVASTSPYLQIYGRLKTYGPSEDILTATSTYASGSDISIIFNEALPSDWEVGKGLFLWSGEGDGFDVATIKTVDTGTKTITIDLGNNLPTATVRASRFFGFHYSYLSTTSVFGYLLIGNNGTLNQSISRLSLFTDSNVYQGFIPDTLDGVYFGSGLYSRSSTFGFAGKAPNMISVATSASVPGLLDTVTFGTDTYRILSQFLGSQRAAVFEN